MAATHDVIVVGAGNAALCAAIAAHEGGARVLVLEKAGEGERGGNTFFSGGGFRFPDEGIDDIRIVIPDLSDAEVEEIDVGSYRASTVRSDLMRVTEGLADPGMVDTFVARAFPTVQWMRERTNVRWVLMYGRQAYRVDGKLRFWGGMIVEAVGAGEGLSDALFTSAVDQGVEVMQSLEKSEDRYRRNKKLVALVLKDAEAIVAETDAAKKKALEKKFVDSYLKGQSSSSSRSSSSKK